MDAHTALDLARWQFAITTVYHFLFVPVTIGLSFVVAVFHTLWITKRDPQWMRLSKFFGKLFTINFALGLVTGIVQEFQFGMNWSDYSRFVGDIFGAPLAIEALLAFFLESVFLGLWIFGWGRIPEKLHAATIWLVHIGTVLSAYFILAANSFMQNPVGYKNNPETGRAELTDFFAVLTNKVQLVTFPHVLFSAYLCGGAFVLGVAAWLVWRNKKHEDRSMYRKAAKFGAWMTLVAGLGVVVTGDIQGKIMTEVQPMKMASAEALYESQSGAPFSILTIGSLDGQHEKIAITVPKLLSFLGTGSFNGHIQGINDLEKAYQAKYASDPLTRADSYTPTIPLTYWSFRLMMGFGFLAMLIAALALWSLRKSNGDNALTSRWWKWLGLAVLLFPILGNSFGWIFTEAGRQPWIVFGLLTTSNGVSPSVGPWTVLLSLVGFTLLYGVLAVIEVGLTLRYAKAGAPPFDDPFKDSDGEDSDDADKQLAFAY